MADAPIVTLPTPPALNDFNLNRYVSSYSPGGNNQKNPFLTVVGVDGENASMPTGDYDNDPNFFMNEVFVEVFNYQPVKIKTTVENGVTKASLDYGGGSAANAPNIIGKFRILLENKDVSISHNHQWKESNSFLSDIYNNFSEVRDKVAFGTSLGVNGLARAGANTEYQTPVSHKVDYQKVYERSDYPTVTIDFQIFTNNNFMRDIYIPVMGLTAFTYPKRFSGRDDQNSPENSDNTWSKVFTALANATNQTENILENVGQQATEFLSLTARQYTFTPPCLFNIYHQSGLYTYSNCFCKNMNVSYSGPWYNASFDELRIFNMVRGGQLSQFVNRRSFPSVANISMTFESTELMMRDDFQLIVSDFSRIANTGNTTFTQFGNTQQAGDAATRPPGPSNPANGAAR